MFSWVLRKHKQQLRTSVHTFLKIIRITYVCVYRVVSFTTIIGVFALGIARPTILQTRLELTAIIEVSMVSWTPPQKCYLVHDFVNSPTKLLPCAITPSLSKIYYSAIRAALVKQMQHYGLKSNVRQANVVKIGFINDRWMSHLVFKTTAEEIFDRRICNIYFEYKKESIRYKQKIIDFSSSSKHNETVSYHNCQFAFSLDRDLGPNLFYRKRIRV